MARIIVEEGRVDPPVGALDEEDGSATTCVDSGPEASTVHERSGP